MHNILVFLLVHHACGQLFFFRKKNNKIADDLLEEKQDAILCKFVQDGSGKIIGESLSIDNDLLIIKSKERFLAVPLRHIESMENTLLVKGLIDLDKAIEMGDQWLETRYKKNLGEK
jgi:hypothetical protein